MTNLSHVKTEAELFRALGVLREQGVQTADIPNGLLPAWFLYGFRCLDEMNEALIGDGSPFEMVLSTITGRIAVSEVYLQQDENGEYMLVH